MSETETEAATDELVLDYELDAPVEKVWRAISIPAFRDKWLPDGALAEAEPVSSAPNEEIRYRMRENAPPFLESIVTFQVSPNADGGTRLRIIHEVLTARRTSRPPQAANSNTVCLMRAA